jgi:hypothetical protein
MLTDKTSFGVLTTYRQWWFFKRGVGENSRDLYISECIAWKQVGEAVNKTHSALQAYAALLLYAQSHAAASSTPATVKTERRPKGRKRDCDEDDDYDERGGGGPAKGSKKSKRRLEMQSRRDGRNTMGGGSGGKKRVSDVNATPMQFGAINFLECSLYCETRLKVFRTNCGRCIVKVADPQRFLAHAALVDEMKCEAAVYAIISSKCADVAPRFIGYGTIAYAPSLAVEFEGASFEELGLENVSRELRLSAMAQLHTLHEQAAVLHGDVRLGNIVCARADPTRAKLIDFGQSTISGVAQQQFAAEMSAIMQLLEL